MKTRSPTTQREASPPAHGIKGGESPFADKRPEAAAQRQVAQWAAASPQAAHMQALQAKADNAMSSGSRGAPIQFVTLGTGTTRTVKVTGNSGSKSFEECTYNSVEYKKNDKKLDTGTGTGTASWAGWLVNAKGGNNATQLHVVNRRWGGLGGAGDKNIVPGTPAENSHHLHEGEKKFDDACFGGAGSTAVQDAKYECTVVPDYGTAVDVTKGKVAHADPKMTVTITTGTGAVNYPITTGAEGLEFKEGS